MIGMGYAIKLRDVSTMLSRNDDVFENIEGKWRLKKKEGNV
jgi:hypothetical protein